jgi:DNA-binding PadR family transcriptional regulator
MSLNDISLNDFLTDRDHCMDVQENLPLREATFFILLSLSATPKHGYAIMKDTAQLSDGRVTLSTGTLYGAIKRLLESGWIKRAENGKFQEDGRAKKAYELTDLGRRIFAAEVARLDSMVTVARNHPRTWRSSHRV